MLKTDFILPLGRRELDQGGLASPTVIPLDIQRGLKLFSLRSLVDERLLVDAGDALSDTQQRKGFFEYRLDDLVIESEIR